MPYHIEYPVKCPYCGKVQQIIFDRNPRHKEKFRVICGNCNKEFITTIIKTKCPYCGRYFNAPRWSVGWKVWYCPYCREIFGETPYCTSKTISRRIGTNYEWGEAIAEKYAGPPSCFILTAAYGSPLATEINIFRRWRDEILSQKMIGKLLVSAYYRISPSIAKFIAKSNTRRWIVRILVKPLILLLKLRLKNQ